MAGKLIHIFKGFLGLIFPQKCLGCGLAPAILCDKCLASLPEAPFSENKTIFSATSYQDKTMKKAIRLLKYHDIKSLAQPLAELMYQRLKKTGFPADLIIPVPLSKKRRRKRGYNQAELIGQFLSDKMSVKMETNVLYKIKDTPSQVDIRDRQKRLKNIIGAFVVKNPEIIRDKNIILIDDITTTGATLSEARKVLRTVGAQKVVGWTVAKGG